MKTEENKEKSYMPKTWEIQQIIEIVDIDIKQIRKNLEELKEIIKQKAGKKLT